ncbi:MAG: amidohydrolase family protein [Candidatus Hadarchaeales archaeon]
MQVLRNALILEGQKLEPSRGVVVIREGRIEKVMRGFPPKKGSCLELKGAVLLPPFVNSHTHVGDSALAEGYLGKTQEEAVGPGGVKFEVERLPPSRVAGAVRETLERMLTTGTLAHCDFREGGPAGVRLLRRLSPQPLRSIVLGRPNGRLQEVLRCSDGLGFPSVEAAESFKDSLPPSGKLLSMHVAETKEAQENSLRLFGKGEIRRALDLNPSFLVHGTWGGEEYELLRKKGVPLVFCPRANHLLGCGSPPISHALELDLKFFLGTDNTMVAEPDMFSELSFAWALVRKENARAGEEETRKLLMAATVDPAAFFGLPWRGLEEGAPATFMVLSGSNLLAQNPLAAVVNRAGARNLRCLYIEGKIYKPPRQLTRLPAA